MSRLSYRTAGFPVLPPGTIPREALSSCTGLSRSVCSGPRSDMDAADSPAGPFRVPFTTDSGEQVELVLVSGEAKLIVAGTVVATSTPDKLRPPVEQKRFELSDGFGGAFWASVKPADSDAVRSALALLLDTPEGEEASFTFVDADEDKVRLTVIETGQVRLFFNDVRMSRGGGEFYHSTVGASACHGS